MGAPKQKWTAEEEEALRAGVLKHGAGKWRTIQRDPEFCRCLASRSNIDLKDKWRNMSLCTGQGSREKTRVPRVKAIPAASVPSAEAVTTVALVKQDGLSAAADAATNAQDAKISPKYTSMIIEALSNVKEPLGLEVGAICSYIEQRHDVPTNFRRLLGSKLRRLVAQNKIEKVERGYKLKETFATKTPTPKQKDASYRVRLSQSSPVGGSIDLVGDAAIAAAYKIAEAEAKSFLASEAAKEAERVSKMAEETESLLMLAREIFERCISWIELFLVHLLCLPFSEVIFLSFVIVGSRGEIVTVA